MSYRKIVLFSNTGWYLYNFRLALAEKLREDGYQVVMVAPKDDYTVKLEELGFRLVYIKMRRNSINPFREALLLNSLRNIFQEENPNIVFNFTELS